MPQGGRRGGRITHLVRSFTEHQGSDDSGGKDEPLPSRLTFNDDNPPALPPLVLDAGKSKDEEIQEYWQDWEREEQEVRAREKGRPPSVAPGEGRGCKGWAEGDSNGGIYPFEIRTRTSNLTTS